MVASMPRKLGRAVVYQGGSAKSYTALRTARQSATSRKVMHRHHFACCLGRSRSRQPA